MSIKLALGFTVIQKVAVTTFLYYELDDMRSLNLWSVMSLLAML